MRVLIRMLALAQVVARNVVPLLRILFAGWSAANVIVLYFWDTLLSLGVVFAGVAQALSTGKDVVPLTGVRAQVRLFVVAAFFCAVLAVPLGLPIGIALAAADLSLGAALRDRSLWTGVLVQSAIAALSYVDLYRALRMRRPTSCS